MYDLLVVSQDANQMQSESSAVVYSLFLDQYWYYNFVARIIAIYIDINIDIDIDIDIVYSLFLAQYWYYNYYNDVATASTISLMNK